MSQVLNVSDLRVTLPQRHRSALPVSLVEQVELWVDAGELVCVVGESGSGKSVTGSAILGLLQEQGLKVEGSVTFEGKELVSLSSREVRGLRGRGLALVPQEPSSALDPLFTVGAQIAEAVRRRDGNRHVRERVLDLLRQVRIPEPETRMDQYPHELSGGLCQRVLIAVALAGRPRLIVADEPTSALDATVQLEVLQLLDQVRAESGTAMLLITHDITVASRADRVVVMYAGRIVEQGTVEQVLERPRHPYTAGLIAAVPRIDDRAYTDGEFRLSVMPGSVPSPFNRPSGCPFRDRCPHAREGCEEEQVLTSVPGDAGHSSACWLATELGERFDPGHEVGTKKKGSR